MTKTDGESVSSVVIFDGFCHFCNGAVNFIIKRDPGKRYLFAANQSESGERLMKTHGISDLSNDTFVLIEGGRYYIKTDAALRIASQLSWPWPFFAAFRVLPSGFRDWFYDVFARRRYRLFGKRETCRLPDEKYRDRFLIDEVKP